MHVQDNPLVSRRRILVAVDATKDRLSSEAPNWAIKTIAKPGDALKLLGILHQVNNPMGYKSRVEVGMFGVNDKKQEEEIFKIFSAHQDYIDQLKGACEEKQLSLDTGILPGFPAASVLLHEANCFNPTWVVMDRFLKKDKKYLSENLSCNLAIIDKHGAGKVFRVNPGVDPGEEDSADLFELKGPLDGTKDLRRTTSDVSATEPFCTSIEFSSSSPFDESRMKSLNNHRPVSRTPANSCQVIAPTMSRTPAYSCQVIAPTMSRTPANSCQVIAPTESEDVKQQGIQDEQAKSKEHLAMLEQALTSMDFSNSFGEDEDFSGHGILSRAKSLPALQMLSPDVSDRHLPPIKRDQPASQPMSKPVVVSVRPVRGPSKMDLLQLLGDNELEEDPFRSPEQEAIEQKAKPMKHITKQSRLDGQFSVDENHGLRIPSGNQGATPLCSLCNNKSPRFGTQPKALSYAEIEEATSNFSRETLLAEGGFGLVYKGKLKDSQLVAVKQHKLASKQGDREFRAEVEVLSNAQHRNLVTLIGYCTEGGRRILVYEYVCNGSLNWHLSKDPNTLEWSSRQKIAVGAARGLRYLHEECRIGCIVHRDMRPNNILVTHDFTALVGDFGLARWQARGDTAEQTRVIGTIGYVAPEYAESGQITEKADVYSFGLVLLEIITGRRVFDSERQYLIEWALPFLANGATHELLDQRIDQSTVDGYELVRMALAAHLCIQKDPTKRPRMSQVVRILEGEDRETTPLSPVLDSRRNSSMTASSMIDPSINLKLDSGSHPPSSRIKRIDEKKAKTKISYMDML